MPRRAFVLFFASVWIINGLVCKVLGLVPRHEAIVGRILGAEHSPILTATIGAFEILMGVWILSQWKWRWSAATQITLVMTMNVIEFVLAPDLLLFGAGNAFVALAYVSVVAYAGFFHAPPACRPA